MDEPLVSRAHARIEPRDDGYVVLDLGSTNLTRVNGDVVAECDLAHGDDDGADAAAHGDDGLHHLAVHHAHVYVADQSDVDLEIGRLQAGDRLEARVAGPHVVDGEAHPEVGVVRHRLAEEAVVLDDELLRDLEDDPRRRHLRPVEECDEGPPAELRVADGGGQGVDEQLRVRRHAARVQQGTAAAEAVELEEQLVFRRRAEEHIGRFEPGAARAPGESASKPSSVRSDRRWIGWYAVTSRSRTMMSWSRSRMASSSTRR